MLIGAVLLAVTAPGAAFAGEPADLRLDVQQGSLSLQAGGKPATLIFAIHNDGPAAADSFVANVNVPFGERGVAVASSSPSCNQVGSATVLSCPVSRLEAGQSTTFTLVIQAPAAGALQQGEVLNGNGQIAASDPGGDDANPANDTGQFTLNVTGAPAPVTQAGGAVTDVSTGKALTGVSVSLKDTNGLTCSTTTDTSGNFSCTPSTPLAGGTITIVASLSGYQAFQQTVTPSNGTIAGVQLAMTPIAASPSPTPSAAPSKAPAASASPQAQIVRDNGTSGTTILFFVLGVVVVLAGLGGIAWWMYRRRDTEVGPDTRPGYTGFEHAMPTVPIELNRTAPLDATLVGAPSSMGYGAAPTAVQALPVGGAPTVAPVSGATTVVSALPHTPGQEPPEGAFHQGAPGNVPSSGGPSSGGPSNIPTGGPGGAPSRAGAESVSRFAHDPGAGDSTAAWDASDLHPTGPIGPPEELAPPPPAPPAPPAQTSPAAPNGWGVRPDDRYSGGDQQEAYPPPPEATPARKEPAGYWYASRASTVPAEPAPPVESPPSVDYGNGYGALYPDGYPPRPYGTPGSADAGRSAASWYAPPEAEPAHHVPRHAEPRPDR
jgi:hypothetical protein